VKYQSPVLRVALPLGKLLPGTLAPGDTLCMNIIRISPDKSRTLAWNPTFTNDGYEPGEYCCNEAAAEAARECDNPPKLVAVTSLTSLSQDDFADLGINRTVSEQALALGELAISSGIDGLVTSAHEVGALRARFPNALLVTPGIRMPDGDVGDQKRVATPSFAVQQGATHLVVGRPIVQANDPATATDAILDDIKNAL